MLKMFQVDLKACLGLVVPASSLSGENEAVFLGNVISWATPTPLWSLLYTTV